MKVTAQELPLRLLLPGVLVSRPQPLVGTDESDVGSLGGPEAELAEARRQTQEGAPAAEHLPFVHPSDPLHHLRGQLGTGEAAAVQGLADSLDELQGVLPGAQPEVRGPAAPVRSGAAALGRHVQAEVLGRQQMERAPHRPGLDQLPRLPELGADRLRRFDARTHADGLLGRRHHLGLDPVDALRDAWRRKRPPPVQPVAAEPVGQDLLPGDLDHGWPTSRPTVPPVRLLNSTPFQPAARASSASSSPLR